MVKLWEALYLTACLRKPRKIIKRATLMKLVEKATQWDQDEYTNFTREFLCTYEWFCTGADLLAIVLERFNLAVKEPPRRAGLETDTCSSNERTEVHFFPFFS